ncbi:nitrogenase molybdenum-iron protein alpha chain [Butyrivibrio sp. ob235]|uniref:nitrogenase component 1 n=1 Tax=Butyrivibrio sp. ob235 TaxID=1761780 RepID=UPI0008BA93BF|nr:nitrogenase component 1 [Butyrivibrio sp. ob235]SEL03802.1 nitrogenase molybdenum-iron protein alpha chain [Butyrivibrio sp. ob235]
MNLNILEAANRETRLGSTVVYEGTVPNLLRGGCQGCSGRKRCFSTAASCSHYTATHELAVVKNCVVVDHGPVGCSAGIIRWSLNYRSATRPNNEPFDDLRVISTNLKESDTVFGAINKLYDTVRKAYKRHKPDIIFITSTCMSSTIGEDFESAVEVLKDEIPVPIVFVGCAGAKSKLWATGFDSEQHALFNALVKPPKEKRNTVNFIDFLHPGAPYIRFLLDKLGLEPLYVNAFATVEDFAHLSESVCTTSICYNLASYMGTALEEVYGVPLIKDEYGAGIQGFDNWYRAIARTVGKEDIAEAYIKEQKEKYLPKLEKYKKILKGKKAIVGMGSGFAFETIRVLKELGMEVLHAYAYHFDPKIDNGQTDYLDKVIDDSKDTAVTIADAQHFETIRVIKEFDPDIVVIRVHGAQQFAMRLGYPTVTAMTLFGYEAVLSLAERMVDEIGNNNFASKLSKHTSMQLKPGFNSALKEGFIEEKK